jgi:WD40 repeat protein
MPQSLGSALRFSPDGETLVMSAMIHKDGRWLGSEVLRWATATGKALPAWPNPPGHKDTCNLAFSPDGRLLAGVDWEGNLVFWDAEKGTVRASWPVDPKRRLISLSFSPDGQTVAIAASHRGRDPEPGLVILWDVSGGRRLATLKGHTNSALCVAFSADGNILASGGSDRTVRLWNVAQIRQAKRAAERP